MSMSGRNLDIFQQKPNNPWIRIIHTIASRVVIKYARALSEMDPAGEGDKLQRININGIILNMIDTAGIRTTDDKIEAIGVEKSKKMMKESDLVLFVLKNNEEITEDIKELLQEVKNKNYLVLINKTDLESKLNLEELDIDETKIIRMSIKNNQGLEELKEKIIELFNISQIQTTDPTYLSNTRSISILKSCLESIKEVEKGLGNNQPIDMIELDIKDIWEKLGTINGTTYEEELLDEMFSRFCLGK